MSFPTYTVSNSGDAMMNSSNKPTLNPNAAEFVPSFLRSPSVSTKIVDAIKSHSNGASAKANLDRSESSKSANSEDETHQYWRRQLPDDIIPDFGTEQAEHRPTDLLLARLSLNPGAESALYAPAVTRLPNAFHDFSLTETESFGVGFNDNLEASFSTPASLDLEQNSLGFAGDYLTEDLFSPLGYLMSQFPGFSAQSLEELYYANNCDFNLTVETLTQLEMQVDFSSHHQIEATSSSPRFTGVDFPALSTSDDRNSLLTDDVQGFMGVPGGLKPLVATSGARNFVSAVRRLPLQNDGNGRLEKKDTQYSNGGSGGALPRHYGANAKPLGSKLQAAGSVRGAPVWLETGEAVANMYSELREGARDLARIRNAYFEQATQAYLVGNKALAKELSAKGQVYNAQMKAAHEKAKEAIFRQRNPVSSGTHDRLIDLHGLHVSEAIHVLKDELSTLRTIARSTGERVPVMICVGTGHHTKGARNARLPVAVEQFLLQEGLHYTQPQPGLLHVLLC